MKIALRIRSLLMIAMFAAFFLGCKKDDPDKKTEEEIQFNKLSGNWMLESANDGLDRTGDFTDLVLTLGGNFVQNGTYNYSLTGTRPNPSPWPVSGTWKFGTNKQTEMIRDPNIIGGGETDMTYSVNDTNLIISFNVPDGSQGWPGSRIRSVSGNWTFTFTK